jgi:hypothetical protein
MLTSRSTALRYFITPLKNTPLQAAQRDLRGEACSFRYSCPWLVFVKAARSRITSTIAGEAIERNEAYESFSAACFHFLVILTNMDILERRCILPLNQGSFLAVFLDQFTAPAIAG